VQRVVKTKKKESRITGRQQQEKTHAHAQSGGRGLTFAPQQRGGAAKPVNATELVEGNETTKTFKGSEL